MDELVEIETRAAKAGEARERLDVYIGGDEDEVANCYDIIAESAADDPLLAEVRRLRDALRSIRDGEAGTLTGAQHLAVLALTHRG